jgi:hypothetical protein
MLLLRSRSLRDGELGGTPAGEPDTCLVADVRGEARWTGLLAGEVTTMDWRMNFFSCESSQEHKCQK